MADPTLDIVGRLPVVRERVEGLWRGGHPDTSLRRLFWARHDISGAAEAQPTERVGVISVRKVFRPRWGEVKGGVKWFAPAVVLWLGTAVVVAQELPPAGGPIPELRRGAGGQIELVPPSAPARRGPNRPNPVAGAPAPPPPKKVRTPSPSATPSRQSPQPVITVTPANPRVPDTTARGAVVATYSITMSDGSPFRGTVRFGAPNYDGNRMFALSGNTIIVNPVGPGLRRGETTVTYHVTLETIP
jgi:hypothetical protein